MLQLLRLNAMDKKEDEMTCKELVFGILHYKIELYSNEVIVMIVPLLVLQYQEQL